MNSEFIQWAKIEDRKNHRVSKVKHVKRSRFSHLNDYNEFGSREYFGAATGER